MVAKEKKTKGRVKGRRKSINAGIECPKCGGSELKAEKILFTCLQCSCEIKVHMVSEEEMKKEGLEVKNG